MYAYQRQIWHPSKITMQDSKRTFNSRKLMTEIHSMDYHFRRYTHVVPILNVHRYCYVLWDVGGQSLSAICSLALERIAITIWKAISSAYVIISLALMAKNRTIFLNAKTDLREDSQLIHGFSFCTFTPPEHRFIYP